MAHLICQTKNNSSTYGKPCVYVSCHSADVSGTVQPLCSQIFDISNCVIYHFEDIRLPNDEKQLGEAMSQVQLLILVCSDIYLQSPNPVRDFEFRFALKKHIPILPVIQTGADVNQFNELCLAFGEESLHCLDKNQFFNDAQYRQKLKEYLDYFLINNEDVKKIRDQFRACIFLSYRKMDAALARDLMQRIHNLQKYYDVAIWYDNFLIPGKSFEEEIFSAMDKSDLFMLAVTSNTAKPNALGEDNYVVKKEYRGALERGKKIVAAALEEPDTKQLLLKFKSLPQCIDAYDDLMLSEALSPLDSKPKKSGAVHDYYIGLAYLNGIDYDVDQKKAFQLIKSAAESGFDLAMEKLVMMYETGSAVKRNYHEAIWWQSQLAALTEEKLQQEDSSDLGFLFIKRLDKFGRLLLELEDNEEKAEAVYQKALDYADRFAKAYEMIGFYMNVSERYSALGDIYIKKADYNKAMEFYQKAFHMIQPLCEHLPDKDIIWYHFSVCAQQLGNAFYHLENYPDAKAAYKSALEVFRALNNGTDRTGVTKFAEANITYYLGRIAVGEKKYEEAEQRYSDSLRHIGAAMIEMEDWGLKLRLAFLWDALGELYSLTSRLEKAAQEYQKAVNQMEEVYFERPSFAIAKALRKLYATLAELLFDLKKYREAEKYPLESARLIYHMFEEFDAFSLTDIFTGSCLSLARIENATNQRLQAKLDFLSEYDAAKKAALETGTDKARRLFGLNCLFLSTYYIETEQTEEARRILGEGIAEFTHWVLQSNDSKLRHLLANLYVQLFRSTPGDGNSDVIKKAYHIWYGLTKEYPENETYKDCKMGAHVEWEMSKP